MRDDGVHGLCRRFGLGLDPTVRQLAGLAMLLAADPLAPTAVREPHRVLDEHLADSLVALELAEVRAAQELLDLGSGAGVPALPLAAARPAARVVALDSRARRTAFIARAAASLGLENVEVVTARAEEYGAAERRFDLVTARALAPLAVVVEYAAPLLRVGGALVVWRGRRDAAAEADGASACEELGLEVGPVQAVRPFPHAEHRHLHLLRKVAATPARFPRGPGIARKRPLGARTAPSG